MRGASVLRRADWPKLRPRQPQLVHLDVKRFTGLIMFVSLLSLLVLFSHFHPSSANTEKVLFLGPDALRIPVEHPTLEALQLEALSPHRSSLRTHISAQFPTDGAKYGQSSWYLLRGLHEGRRYEVRICWAAIVSSLRDDVSSADRFSNQPLSDWKRMSFHSSSRRQSWLHP